MDGLCCTICPAVLTAVQLSGCLHLKPLQLQGDSERHTWLTSMRHLHNLCVLGTRCWPYFVVSLGHLRLPVVWSLSTTKRVMSATGWRILHKLCSRSWRSRWDLVSVEAECLKSADCRPVPVKSWGWTCVSFVAQSRLEVRPLSCSPWFSAASTSFRHACRVSCSSSSCRTLSQVRGAELG